jgi:hypothetical protein
MTNRRAFVAAWQPPEGQMSMSKPHDFRWNPRRHVFAPPKPRKPQPVSRMTIGILAMLVIVGAGAIYVYDRQPGLTADTHVIPLQPHADGFTGPLGSGRISLSFITSSGARYIRIELRDSAGRPLQPQPGTIVSLDSNTAAGARQSIAFRRDGTALVSATPVQQLADRSILVIIEGRTRHVFALDEHALLLDQHQIEKPAA